MTDLAICVAGSDVRKGFGATVDWLGSGIDSDRR
jgi:hypothetical protein